METHGMTFRVIRASLIHAGERLRGPLPRPEPEVYSHTARADAMAAEGVPKEMESYEQYFPDTARRAGYALS